MRSPLVLALLVLLRSLAHAQTPAPQFEVVSIKRHTAGDRNVGFRKLPDGTTTITNQPIIFAFTMISPVPLRDVIGLRDWMRAERYDITTKPAAGTPPDQQKAMWEAMFADRMKLVGHVEQRQHDVYALALARRDGKLGPELKASTLDCTPPSLIDLTAGPAPNTPPSLSVLRETFSQRCGVWMAGFALVSAGATLDQLAAFLEGPTSAAVENRTGLQGLYAFTLMFSPQRLGPSIDSTPDDAPDIFTAVQEQLGLKLHHDKKQLPVFVIDHIERPSEN